MEAVSTCLNMSDCHGIHCRNSPCSWSTGRSLCRISFSGYCTYILHNLAPNPHIKNCCSEDYFLAKFDGSPLPLSTNGIGIVTQFHLFSHGLKSVRLLFNNLSACFLWEMFMRFFSHRRCFSGVFHRSLPVRIAIFYAVQWVVFGVKETGSKHTIPLGLTFGLQFA